MGLWVCRVWGSGFEGLGGGPGIKTLADDVAA